MVSSQMDQEFDALMCYNRIVQNFLLQIQNPDCNLQLCYNAYSQQIDQIKCSFSYIFENEQSIPDDILNQVNPFRLLLYFSITIQWKKLIDVSHESLRKKHETFICNLIFFSSGKFYSIITNLSTDEQIKSLVKTLALYFYVCVPDACFIGIGVIFKKLMRNNPIRISCDNAECLSFFRELTSSSLVYSSFAIIEPSVNLEELFDHVCNCSYYASFTEDLFGLTAIGDFIFINDNFERTENLYRAATLVTLLHESGHLAKRFRKKQSAYLILTPDKDKESGLKYNSEMGNFLETLIFGKRLTILNTSSAEFLMNRDNWDLSRNEFCERLDMIHKEGEKRAEEHCNVGKNSDPCSSISIGRCGMAQEYQPRNLTSDFEDLVKYN